MSSEEKQNKTKKLLPVIISIAVVGVLVAGVVLLRGMLAGDDALNLPAPKTQYVREHNAKMGNSESGVQFVYLFDFSCGACQANKDNMKQIKDKYKDDIEFVYKSLITQAGTGDRSALAVYAAGMQDQYFEYYDKLINFTSINGAAVSDQQYQDLANEIGLDVDQFNQDRFGVEARNYLEADKQDIRAAVVPESRYTQGIRPTTTPSTVIIKDGEVVTWWSGVVDLDTASTRIDIVLGRESASEDNQSAEMDEEVSPDMEMNEDTLPLPEAEVGVETQIN